MSINGTMVETGLTQDCRMIQAEDMKCLIHKFHNLSRPKVNN